MKIVVMTYLGKLEQYHSSFYHRTPPRLILPSQILLCIWKSKHHHELFSWIGHLVFLTSNFHHIPLLKNSSFITLILKSPYHTWANRDPLKVPVVSIAMYQAVPQPLVPSYTAKLVHCPSVLCCLVRVLPPILYFREVVWVTLPNSCHKMTQRLNIPQYSVKSNLYRLGYLRSTVHFYI